MKCPHCKKQDNNEDHRRADRNAESYGSNVFHFRCTKCKQKYSAYYEVQIRTGVIRKDLPKQELSFGDNI